MPFFDVQNTAVTFLIKFWISELLFLPEFWIRCIDKAHNFLFQIFANHETCVLRSMTWRTSANIGFSTEDLMLRRYACYSVAFYLDGI